MLIPAFILALVAGEPVLEATLTPDPGREVPGFGGALAYADPWLVVGWDDPGGTFDVLLPARPVHVFRRDGSVWKLDAVIETESAGCYEVAVATDGARIAIGLPEELDRKASRVLVLARQGETWQLEAEFGGAACWGDEDSEGLFASSVALRSERLFVGAPSCPAKEPGGNVFTYGLEDGAWKPQAFLPGRSTSHHFGEALALGDEVLIVADPAQWDGLWGSCTAFDLRGTASADGRLLSRSLLPCERPSGFDGEHRDGYASAVAAHGSTAAVSQPFTREYPLPSGDVHIYGLEAAARPQYQRVSNPGPGPSVFGAPVALGSRFLVATWRSPFVDRVYAFEREATGTFVPTGELEAPRDDVAAFGHALATQGPRIVVGAPSEARRSGRVLVYRID